MNNSPLTVTLGGVARPLVWNNGALYRADELGLPVLLAAGKSGYSTLCKMIWVMMDEAGRKALPTPEAVANLVPMKMESVLATWKVVLEAYSLGSGVEDSDSKKENGVSERLPG